MNITVIAKRDFSHQKIFSLNIAMHSGVDLSAEHTYVKNDQKKVS